MTGKRWAVAAVVATLLAGSGCVCCHHQACKVARDVAPDCPLPAADRQRVYLFMVNGLTPNTPIGLDGLRDQVNRQGFAKVACGELFHVPWMAAEIRRIHDEDPAARFVLLGYDVGGPAAARLAADARARGVPVDAVVLIDPIGNVDPTGGPQRVVLLSSSDPPPAVTHTESVTLPGVGHFKLPTHPKSVAAVTQTLTDAAGRIDDGGIVTPDFDWTYEHAPPARPITAPGPDAPAEWNFLLDLPGNHTDALTPVDAPRIVGPAPSRGLAPGLQNYSVTRPRP
jgi:hypothetical protein